MKNGLTPREKLVLCMRFSLDDGKFYTLEEVGTKLALSKERTRQIEAKALRKIIIPYLRERQEQYKIEMIAKRLTHTNRIKRNNHGQ